MNTQFLRDINKVGENEEIGKLLSGNVGIWLEILEFGGKLCHFQHKKLWEIQIASWGEKTPVFPSPGFKKS